MMDREKRGINIQQTLEDSSVLSHDLQIRDKMEEMTEVVMANLEQTQTYQKAC